MQKQLCDAMEALDLQPRYASFESSAVASKSSTDSDTYTGTFASTVGDGNTCTTASSSVGDDNTATIASTAVSSHEANKGTMKQRGLLHGVLSSIFGGA